MSMTMPPLAKGEPVPEQLQLMERVVERSNMQLAYRRVKRNKGTPGVDGMSVEQLGGFLRILRRSGEPVGYHHILLVSPLRLKL